MSLKGLEIAEKTADELSKVLRKDLSQLTEATADQIVKLRYLLNENENAFRRPADPAVLSRIRKLLTETDKQYLELLQNPTANSRLFTDRYARQLSQALSQKQALLLESELKFQQFKIRQMKTQLDRQTEILNESRLRQAHADALRAGGLVPEQYDRLTAQDVVTMHTKKAGSKTLGEYMENLYNEYGLVYRQSYIDAMAGQKSEKEIIRRMRQQSDITAGKAALIVRTEANAIFNDQIARQIMENPLIAGYRFRATLDRRTSDICQKIDGKYFDKKELKPGVNFPPLHPNCRSTVETVMVYDLDAQKERIARGKNDEWLTVPGGTNYEDFKRILNNDTRTRGTAQETGQNPAAQTQIDHDLAQRIEKQETVLEAEFIEKSAQQVIEEVAKSDREKIAEMRKHADLTKVPVPNSERDATKGLSKKHQKALRAYTGDAYVAVNNFFRGGDFDEWDLMPLQHEGYNSVQDFDNVLQQAFDEVSLKTELQVSRATSLSGALRFLGITPEDEVEISEILDRANSLIEERTPVRDKGYMSTTLNPMPDTEFAEDAEEFAQIFISLPEGAKAIYAEPITESRGEEEVILNRGSAFRIIGVEDIATKVKLSDGTREERNVVRIFVEYILEGQDGQE
nr:MAG TPA: minor capsid protein [Caudoviricetes sp.]